MFGRGRKRDTVTSGDGVPDARDTTDAGDTQPVVTADPTVTCRLCEAPTVPDELGRCRLGHRVVDAPRRGLLLPAAFAHDPTLWLPTRQATAVPTEGSHGGGDDVGDDPARGDGGPVPGTADDDPTEPIDTDDTGDRVDTDDRDDDPTEPTDMSGLSALPAVPHGPAAPDGPGVPDASDGSAVPSAGAPAAAGRDPGSPADHATGGADWADALETLLGGGPPAAAPAAESRSGPDTDPVR